MTLRSLAINQLRVFVCMKKAMHKLGQSSISRNNACEILLGQSSIQDKLLSIHTSPNPHNETSYLPTIMSNRKLLKETV